MLRDRLPSSQPQSDSRLLQRLEGLWEWETDRRAATHACLKTAHWERISFSLVVLYCGGLFIAVALDAPDVRLSFDYANLKSIDAALLAIDLIFLTLLLFEASVCYWVYGAFPFLHAFTLFDLAVKTTCFVATTVAISSLDDAYSNDTNGFSAPLRTVRGLRVVRFCLAVFRLNGDHARAQGRRILGSAAPAAKVVEILSEFSAKASSEVDLDSFTSMIDIITKEELYKSPVPNEAEAPASEAEGSTLLSQGHFPASQRFRSRRQMSRLEPPRSARSSFYRPAMGSSRADVDLAPSRSAVKEAGMPLWLSMTLGDSAILSALEQVDEWDFDVFALDRVSDHRPIVVGGIFMIRSLGLVQKLKLPMEELVNFLVAIEAGYIPTNPFHNAVHAADVMFTLRYFLQRPFFSNLLAPLDVLAALLAALSHDFAHPGVSNTFLINARTDEAILYNDQSVLEMFHAAGTFRVMLSKPGCDLTKSFTREQFLQLRETMIAMILSTDMKYHFQHLNRMRERMATDKYATVQRKDVVFLLGQALHAADISNPTKPRALQLQWTERVMTEFFLQGDYEKALHLPVSAFMDRDKPAIAQCQIGFISVLVKPLYVEMRNLLGEGLQIPVDTVQCNLNDWETEGDGMCRGWELLRAANLPDVTA